MKLSKEQKDRIAQARKVFLKAKAENAAPRNEKLMERYLAEHGVFLPRPKR